MGMRYAPFAKCTSSISRLSRMLGTELAGRLSRGYAEDTLFILTADHGQLDVDPSRTMQLNTYPRAIPR